MDRRTANRSLGFTLVELLVVVSIIALLVAILLPSLKKAREQAKMAKCLVHLRGLAMASMTYASSDRQEHAVPVHAMTVLGPDPGTYDWGGKSGSGEPLGSNSAFDSVWGTRNGRGPSTRPLNDVIYKSGFKNYQDNRGPGSRNWIADAELELATFRCPSDRGYRGHHVTPWSNSELSSFDHYGTSYAANTLWCTWHRPNQCSPIIHAPFMRPISRVPNPGNTIYYMENCGRFGWHINLDEKNVRCATTSDGPHYNLSDDKTVVVGWHGGVFQFTSSFVDGHAGLIKMQGHQVPPPHQSYYQAINGREMGLQAWDCHIIRGPGWQLDTMPGAFTTAPFACDISNLPANYIR